MFSFFIVVDITVALYALRKKKLNKRCVKCFVFEGKSGKLIWKIIENNTYIQLFSVTTTTDSKY